MSVQTSKIKNALSLAAAAFALCDAANRADGAFACGRTGVFAHAAKAAQSALETVFGADIAGFVCECVWDCNEYEVSDLIRHVRDAQVAQATELALTSAHELTQTDISLIMHTLCLKVVGEPEMYPKWDDKGSCVFVKVLDASCLTSDTTVINCRGKVEIVKGGLPF